MDNFRDEGMCIRGRAKTGLLAGDGTKAAVAGVMVGVMGAGRQ